MSTRGSNDNPKYKIHFMNVLSSVPVPVKLLKGVPVSIVAATGGTKPYVLAISEDKFTLSLTDATDDGAPKRASLFRGGQTQSSAYERRRAVDVGEMDRIQRGQSTMEFERAKKLTRPARPPALASRVTSSSTPAARQATGGSRSTSVSSSSSVAAVVTPLSPTSREEDLLQLDPQRSFSIIFRGAHTVDLMAESFEERNVICDTLDRILSAYARGKKRVAYDVQLLRYVWALSFASTSSTDVLQTEQRMSEKHIRNLLQEINYSVKARDLTKLYDGFGKVIGLDRAARKHGLTFEQTATFLHKVKRDSSWKLKPVVVIWNELFGEVMNNGKMRMSVSDKTFLERFLHYKQGQVHTTIVDVRKLFHKLHDLEIAHTSTQRSDVDLNRISRDQFEAFLLMHANDVFDPAKERHDKADMDQPLSEYWINSSHNTYLIGDQYTSQSSVEMYSNALYRGCRCLELDIWDGGRDSKGGLVPVVWHGHTMTSKISFVDILQTIKVFLNFHPDSFPIILSFENHCSIPYQQVMAETLERVLGDSLYIPTEVSLYGKLPSPSQLRGQVVIKGRRPDGTEADAYDTDDDSDDGRGATSSMGFSTLEEQEAREKVQQYGVAPELAKLTLFHGHKFNTWEDSLRSPTHHMHSFSENKVRSRCRHKEAFQWIIYNQTHMSRTYPAGSRVDSSNYNPLLGWSTGCQMVALNFQTQDQFLRLNDGRFRENGSCGYVLKPPSLMMKGDFDPESNPVQLSIRVLTGSCLPKPRGQRVGDCIDPYVKVSVYDVKNEERESITSFLTSPAPQNGFCPIWGQDKFTFYVENWAVAMLQFTVLHKDEFIASSSIPISCLRRGIRSVKLFDLTNTRSGAFDFATLLVEIKIGQVIAEI